jgi:hypothetical protein
MTDDRELSRILERWFVDGPTEMPDRVIDVVAAGIARQRQRPAWRLDRRLPQVNTPLRAIAALAAVVILAIGGIYLVGPGSGSGVGGPAGSPSPLTTGSSVASPTTVISSILFRPGLRVTTPAGWQLSGGADSARSVAFSPTAQPSGDTPIEILVMSGPFVAAADADCQGRPAVGAGATSAELVAAFSSGPAVRATAAGTVDIGGHAGQVFDFQLAPAWTGTCSWSEGKPATLILLATAQGPGFGLGGTERARLILVDVGDRVVAIIVSSPDSATAPSVVAQTMPIVESITFEP